MPAKFRISYGPFAKGAVDALNPLLGVTGSLKDAQNLYVVGANQLLVRPGSAAVMTFKDDQATPANITSILGMAPLNDRVVVVGHSTGQTDTYVYLVKSDFTGWYNATDVLQSNTNAQPIGVLWAASSAQHDVSIAEGLGVAYIAHAAAADTSALNWPTKSLTLSAGTWTIANVTSDLDGAAGAEALYFNFVASFQNHLWGSGFGSGTTAANGYRPELARFSTAGSYGAFASADSITLGDRVRSERERIVAMFTPGSALYLASYTQLSEVTGYGRSSWQRTPLDKSYGIVGPKAFCVAGDTAYYWSSRGPMRVRSGERPERLWDPIANGVADAINGGAPQKTVVGFDKDRDQVLFFYQENATDGVLKFCAFDVGRDIWLGPTSRVGVQVFAARDIEPVYSTASPPAGPSAAPTAGTPSGIGTTSATLPWTNGDSTAETEVEYRVNGGSSYTLATTAAPGVASHVLTGLAASTTYNWRVRHKKNGQYSAYSTGANFTTTASQLSPPTNLTLTAVGGQQGSAEWTNSSDTGQSTYIYSGTSPSPTTLHETVSPGVGSVVMAFSATGVWYIRAKHVKSGSTDSDYTADATATIT